MRKISITICFLVISLFHPNVSFGQEIKVFPDLTGTTVNDSIVTIPDNTKGKYTLIGLAFSKKSEASLETWLQPAFYKFIEPKLVKSPFASFTYDVNIYFVPMFTGINAAAAK